MSKAKVVCAVVLLAVMPWLLWRWGFCRFYVEPGEMAVVMAKTGRSLPPDHILAEAGEKGIQKDVLGEGRHFLNPIFYSHEIRKVIDIAPGKVGVVTSKVGGRLPDGEFLADSRQKGIWRVVLGPGRYRLNPHGYNVDVVDAMSIPIGYAGVITSLSGEQAAKGEFAEAGQKGVRKDILQPGLYYVNPKAFKVDVLEIGVNQVSLLGKEGSAVITKSKLASQNAAMEELQGKVLQQQKEKRLDYVSKIMSRGRDAGNSSREWTARQQEQANLEAAKKQYLQGDSMATLGLAQFVEFPSRDGFEIYLDMTVEIELLPDQIAWIFRKYGDLPAVVDKIIMPQITSISRNKGSEYRAKDFIVGEGREKFQDDLTKALRDTFAGKKIIVHNALIRHVEVPAGILAPIQQASIAVEQNLTNKEKQNTAKMLAELNTEITLIEQRRSQVIRETEKLVAEIHADQEKQTATIQAQARKRVAEIAQQTADVAANTVRMMANARAQALQRVEGERARGLQLKTQAFDDSTAFALWEFANNLNRDVNISILHAGEGTLWTDLDKARTGDLGGAVLMRERQGGGGSEK